VRVSKLANKTSPKAKGLGDDLPATCILGMRSHYTCLLLPEPPRRNSGSFFEYLQPAPNGCWNNCFEHSYYRSEPTIGPCQHVLSTNKCRIQLDECSNGFRVLFDGRERIHHPRNKYLPGRPSSRLDQVLDSLVGRGSVLPIGGHDRQSLAGNVQQQIEDLCQRCVSVMCPGIISAAHMDTYLLRRDAFESEDVCRPA
jgi:hypothetical protein